MPAASSASWTAVTARSRTRSTLAWGDSVQKSTPKSTDDSASSSALAVVPLEACGPGGDLLDGALVVLDADPVARHERLAQQDQDAGEEVLQDVIEREAHRHRGDPESGHEVAGAERREDDHGRDERAEDGEQGDGERAEEVLEAQVDARALRGRVRGPPHGAGPGSAACTSPSPRWSIAVRTGLSAVASGGARADAARA